MLIIYAVGRFLSRKKSNSKDIDDGPYGEDVNDFEEVVIEEENEDVNLEFTSNQNPDGEDCLEDSAGPLGKSDSPTNKKAESNSTHQVNDFVCFVDLILRYLIEVVCII